MKPWDRYLPATRHFVVGWAGLVLFLLAATK